MTEDQRIHAESLVVDAHADTPQRFVDEGWSFTDPVGAGMLSLDTAHAGNLAAEFFAIWAEPTEWRGRYAFRTLQLIDGVYEQLRTQPTALRLGLTPEDILQAYAEGVFCVLLGIEGGHSIENDLGLLRLYHRLGVRYMTLTWSNTNEWADSSGDLEDAAIHHHGGLTGFGRKVVREMNRSRHDLLGRTPDHPRAHHRLAFERACTHRLAAQPHRRAASRHRHQRRRRDGQLLSRLHRRRLAHRLEIHQRRTGRPLSNCGRTLSPAQ
jgi:hypothetical protein